MKNIFTVLMLAFIVSTYSIVSQAQLISSHVRSNVISQGLNINAFDKAVRYYLKYYNTIENKKYISFIDFNLPSTTPRLFIINVETGHIEKFLVAHGRKSGNNYATSFSNSIGSDKSSLGLYKVQEEYKGKHGTSLKLDGIESTNSNARVRKVVMHSAPYVSKKFIKDQKTGELRLGRSEGCPAMNENDFKQVRPKIKNGSLLYIYK